MNLPGMQERKQLQSLLLQLKKNPSEILKTNLTYGLHLCILYRTFDRVTSEERKNNRNLNTGHE